MADIIRLLPEYLANQIAAGEVVQRPASVVKELLENSVDAGATSVQLIVKEAGKQLIQVVDNGAGMSETDARMSFERHATSKIKTTEDLFRIKTMGFRGEALASIAAVAQVELKTKKRDADTGTRLVIEGSEIVEQSPVATPDGTSFCVKNLFFNVPARRNFLKTNAVEMRHILDEFQRVALANPQIAFSLYQNDSEVYKLSAGKLSQRIINLFGNNYKEQMASVEEDTDVLQVRGYIGKPEFSKKTRGEQFFFVNNRFIKSGYLNHAVMNAYEGLLPKDSHPFYVLFLEIEPQSIDINVHPTKTEIKFENEKVIYAIVQSAVKKSLGVHNIAPSLDFDGDVNFAPLNPVRLQPTSTPDFGNFEKAKSYNAMVSGQKSGNTQNWEQLYEVTRREPTFPKNDSLPAGLDFGDEPVENKPLTFPSSINSEKAGSKAIQVQNKFVLVPVKSGIMLVDQQAAQERILFEKFSSALDKKTGVSQTLLFPQAISFSPSDYSLVIELSAEFQDLGFQLSEFGHNTMLINGIPADVPPSSEKELLESLLEQYKNNLSGLKLNKRESLARAMAKRVAARFSNRLSDLEMNALVDKLFACQTPNYTPDGHKTIVMLDKDRLQEFFK
ncbi:DNA mismatch repair endonuclease MutL [Adhaeribacter sp. BT258]|uniref:DNA mismatch repair protein MutL n=1 Tax=Adhaeribacter terrigena TaxID=2793070 RepID=A0ABS1BXW6_9BACT|nr:DNA mismatch repair endonuclease MutL [Adhaeribacter terrigena]MBK0401752.1 DNA mismatch repair endonuclease MutL [Adhaeribacter terrigena]